MLAVILAAALTAGPDSPPSAYLDAALRSFARARALIARQVGNGQAIDLGYRLVQDRRNAMMTPPASYAADWQDALEHESAIDVQAVADLAAQSPARMTPQRSGLYETFVRSSADGLLAPAAVYVPANAHRGGPLALLLHGNQQSETNLLGQPYFRRLADRTGTILIAPWGRGTRTYEGAAAQDVYDVLEAARAAYAPDPRRIYLVGYSMGGFNAFTIGLRYRNWSAVMDVCGALQGDAGPVAFAWRTTPLYVVTGRFDTTVPDVYPEHTATVLSQLGVPTSFYEQPDGSHALRTLVPALTAAWLDMHQGSVHSGSIRESP